MPRSSWRRSCGSTAEGADIALQTLGDESDGAVLVDQSFGDHR